MVSSTTLNLREIFSHFESGCKFHRSKPIKTGHINDSYQIIVEESYSSGFFLQKINHAIFKDVEGLMKNIHLVTNHLTSKLENSGDSLHKTLKLIPALDGQLFWKSAEGEYWRMFDFLGETHTYDIVNSDEIAGEGGKAFGRFLDDLADMDASMISETIPGFHNMELRLNRFRRAVLSDIYKRAAAVKPQLEFVEKHAAEMLRIPELMKSGELPLRITHNDTKFNNVLFNEKNKAVCIVDLDTVMPGSILFDFGDAIRTGANTACEDEHDLSKVGINMPIYKAYAEGFIQGSGGRFSTIEKQYLAFGAQFMTFIIGLRFLTDYLEGDPYFKTQYSEHNLVRARVQFRLIEAMEQQKDAMEAIIAKASDSFNLIKTPTL